MLPPPEYWTCKYQGPEGGAIIDTWRHAYELGAQTALQDNVGQWHYVPCSPSSMVCGPTEFYQKGYEEIDRPPPLQAGTGLAHQSPLHYVDAGRGHPLQTSPAPHRLPAAARVEPASEQIGSAPLYATGPEQPYSDERRSFDETPKQNLAAREGFPLAQGPELVQRLSYVAPEPEGSLYGERPPFSPLSDGRFVPPPALLEPHHSRVLRDFTQ